MTTGKKTRVFECKEDDGEEIEKTKALAVRWADGENVEDEGADGEEAEIDLEHSVDEGTGSPASHVVSAYSDSPSSLVFTETSEAASGCD